MTDKEIVEKAKEAEKRTGFGELVHSPISKGVNSAYGIGFIEGMVEYRNSLQEEPVSEDFEKIVEEIAEPTILNAYGTKELARRLRNTICGTSVSEDLLVAANKAFQESEDKESYAETFEDGFLAGADWQKRKDSISSKDLEELINTLSKRYPEVSFAKLSRIAVRVAKWQKEQVAKKAGDWVDANIEKYISADGEYNVDWSITDDLEKHLNVE